MSVSAYTNRVPKLWKETIEAHRREVSDAILDTTAALVAEHGLVAVTMSEIAEETGIGRATLYKYFPDVESILLAWHERQVTGHLERLAEVRERAGKPGERLAAVLETYALIVHESREQHGSGGGLGGFAAGMHRDEEHHAQHHGGHSSAGHMTTARQQLTSFVEEALTAAATGGEARDDVAPRELASYCLHALAAAASLPSKAAVQRLVAVTLSGLRGSG